MQINKRTPCVGICSTTYGDLVCRGCKRFAHEIVQWNGYDATQQDAVRERLSRLRDEILEALLVCHEPGLLRAALGEAGLADLDQKEGQYQLLRLMVREKNHLPVRGLLCHEERLRGLTQVTSRRQSSTPSTLCSCSMPKAIDAPKPTMNEILRYLREKPSALAT